MLKRAERYDIKAELLGHCSCCSRTLHCRWQLTAKTYLYLCR